MKTIDLTTEFQEKCSNFVNHEVWGNMSSWIDFYQKHNECWFEELENFHLIDDNGNAIYDGCDNEEGHFPEILEWWKVSPYLYEKLKKHGEVVWHHEFGDYIWGRCTSGQSISIDYVIEKIIKDLY